VTVAVGAEHARVRAPAPLTASARRRSRGRSLLAGSLLFVAIVALSFAAPLLTPYDPTVQILSERLLPPAWVSGGTLRHPLGTDGFGRDVLSRLLYGARVSLVVGAGAVFLSGLVGVGLGLIAGYRGGWWEMVIMRLSDVQQALPAVLLAIIVVAVGGANVVNLVLVLALSSWVIYARVIYARTVSLRHREFVEAAQAIGATAARIILRHLLPNMWAEIMVVSALQAGRMMLLEAGLSFLGLGVPAPAPSWGSMLADARTYVYLSPWPAAIPGLAIVAAVWSVNLLGEGLRRRSDPHNA
jgi:peptide/nickel transport system permease protein